MGELKQSDKSSGQPLNKPLNKPLNFDETYRCPACGSGELSAIAMMDVFACDFCRHMFTANLSAQSVHLADSIQPMSWQ